MKGLCIDIGNTKSKLALVDNFSIVKRIDFESVTASQIVEEITTQYSIDNVIISNVTDFAIQDLDVLKRIKNIYLLNENLPLPFASEYTTPTTLGNDRKAILAALQYLYPNENSLGIALGTCITYNFLADGKIFKGGAISPGMHMRFKAMHDYTKKLPLAPIVEHIDLIGQTTIESLQSGVIHGISHEIEGCIEAYRKDYDKINVVLTGGDSAYFSTRLKCKIFADENLIFKGLYALLQFQNQ